MSAGYSNTPLAKKLGIKEGFSVMLYNEPSHYLSLFSDFPDQINFREDDTKESIDFIHAFCTTLKQLREMAPTYMPLLKKKRACYG